MPLHSLLRDEHGQTMSEYALVIGVITLALFAAVGFLSGAVETVIRTTGALLP
jgi:Flp pilus assembly pilin Flp